MNAKLYNITLSVASFIVALLSFDGVQAQTSSRNYVRTLEPLFAEKYYDLSPYASRANNPFKYIDKDGREKKLFNKEKDSPVISEIVKKDKNPTYSEVDFYAHGEEKRVAIYDEKADKIKYVNANGLTKIIKKSFKKGNDLGKMDSPIVVLHSCNTGKGDNSIGQQLSKELGNVVVAPNGYIVITKFSETVVNNPKLKKTGDNVNHWNIFFNGKLIGTVNLGGDSPSRKNIMEKGEPVK